MTQPFLPYGKQTITEKDIAAVTAAMQAPMLTTGPRVEEFEQAFAERLGAREAVSCANGTAALHLAAMALGLGAGDVVLAPSLSFVASANGPHYTGASVAFIDCDPDTGLVTPELFSKALERAGNRVRAAVIVHLNGETADMYGISRIAAEHDIMLIEDACHAIGTRHAGFDGEMDDVGNCRHSAIACFSLHPVKTITMGEGGVATTNDPELAKRMRMLRNHGISRDADAFTNAELAFAPSGAANPWYYEMAEPGYNYRATDVACALGLSQLSQLNGFIARRKAIKAGYDRLFDGFDSRVRPVPTRQSCDPCRHLYPVLVEFSEFGKSRAEVMLKLEKAGIGSQVHYIPIHLQPYYRQMEPDLTLPGAEHYYARALSLPLFSLMEDGDVIRVVEALAAALKS